jgi:NADP-dependent 3-hydroxy acid dehydrogenase YdfG
VQDLANELAEAKCPGEVCPVTCDLTKEAEIFEMFELIKHKYKRLDVCINNAGVCHADGLLNGKTEHWRNMFEVRASSTGLTLHTLEFE